MKNTLSGATESISLRKSKKMFWVDLGAYLKSRPNGGKRLLAERLGCTPSAISQAQQKKRNIQVLVSKRGLPMRAREVVTRAFPTK